MIVKLSCENCIKWALIPETLAIFATQRLADSSRQRDPSKNVIH